MSFSDPIADMLTRIRNAQMAEHEVVDVPHSAVKAEIAHVLKKEGFIVDYVVESTGRKVIRIYLKYVNDTEPVIKGLERESRPGLRHYVSVDKLPKVLGGLGVAIISTSKGIMTCKEAKEQNVGGEFLCSIW